jgi:hypothetical protein
MSNPAERGVRGGTFPCMRKMTAAVIAWLAGAAAVSLILAHPAHATRQCADQMAGNLQAYYGCVGNSLARCAESGGPAQTLGILRGHITCVYPDGSRDECDYNGIPGYGTGTCNNFPVRRAGGARTRH